MHDREKVIKGLEGTEIMLKQAVDRGGEMAVMGAFKCYNHVSDALVLLKEQDAKEHISDCFEPWDVLWKAPDGTFKGRCDNCGFVHVFIEGHVTQYKFCPQCGEQKQEL